MLECVDLDAVSDSLMSLYRLTSELLAEVAYVYLDYFLVCPHIVDSPYLLCEF